MPSIAGFALSPAMRVSSVLSALLQANRSYVDADGPGRPVLAAHIDSTRRIIAHAEQKPAPADAPSPRARRALPAAQRRPPSHR